MVLTDSSPRYVCTQNYRETSRIFPILLFPYSIYRTWLSYRVYYSLKRDLARRMRYLIRRTRYLIRRMGDLIRRMRDLFRRIGRSGQKDEISNQEDERSV